MSNYHVLEGTNDGRRYRVVFHIPIPAENNDVPDDAVNDPLTLRQAIVNDPRVNKVSIVPDADIAQSEKDQIAAGEILEYAIQPVVPGTYTPAEVKTLFDSISTDLQTLKLEEIRNRYRFMGYKSN